MKGATGDGVVLGHWVVISIHAPVKGATVTDYADNEPLQDFNPRSREGSDNPVLVTRAEQQYFNPRSREGSDLMRSPARLHAGQFQSTLP